MLKTALLAAMLIIPIADHADSRLPIADSRHLRLSRSEPGADSTVTAVASIKLWYSQPVELNVTTVRLVGEGNRLVALAAPTRSREANAPIVLTLTDSITPGRYTAHWRTMARDGHAVSGQFAFTLAAPGTATHDH